MKSKVEYTINKRVNKSGFSWQVQFKDEHGIRKSPITVESLRNQMGLCEEYGTHHIKSKVEAIRIVEGAIQKGYTGKKADGILAKDYIRDFYDWAKSDYIHMQNKRKPGTISEATAKISKTLIENHVIKSERNTKVNDKVVGWYFPDNLLLRDVTPQMIEKLEKSVLVDKGLKTSTWNSIYARLHCIFAEAERLELIGRNPCDRVKRVAIPLRETTRGCFSESDFTTLMSRIALEISRDASIEPLGNMRLIEPSLGLGLLLLGESGMRPGELRALTVADFSFNQFSDICTIEISKAIDNLGNIGETKTRTTRYAYCSATLGKAIVENALHGKPIEGNEGTLCFSMDGKKPIGHTSLYYVILRYIEALGLPMDDEDGKKISLYSLRHYCNTQLNIRGNASVANTILGHKEQGDAMNERYCHMNKEQQALRIGQEIGSILPKEIIAKIG